MSATHPAEAEFDRRAPGYDSEIWYQAQARLVLAALAEAPPASVLDVGCGTGWLLRRLAAERPGLHGLGIDVSRGMIERARRSANETGLSGLAFERVDWESAPAPGQADPWAARPFDAVLCVSAFHYFAEPDRAAARLRSVLRPGGRLLLVDRDRQGSLATRVWDIVHRRVLRDGVRFYAAGEIVGLLEAAGFTAVRVRERVQRWLWQGKLYTALVLIEAHNP